MKGITLIIAIVFSLWSSSTFESCIAATRGNYHWRKLKAASATNFNVLDYGAKGDGHADDTKVNFRFTPLKYTYMYLCACVH